jgi:predicted Zn-dependent protease
MLMFLVENKMKNYFLDLVHIIKSNINEKERFITSFSGEVLDFTRFNQGKVRQAGTIQQQFLDLELINGNKHAKLNLGLSHDLSTDRDALLLSIGKLREQLMHSHEDPYFMVNDNASKTENITPCTLPEKEVIVHAILKHAAGLDLVGYYISGPIYKGFASSSGQFNWFEKSSFIIDTSVYHSGDKAIKQSYADTQFNEEVLAQKIDAARRGLKLFDKESLTITPGHYRVYFSPTAVHEIISMMNWGGFSRKSLETKNSPLMPLASGQRTLSSAFSISEHVDAGIGPHFQSQGFIKKGQINVIDQGQLKNTLISPKTAKEYCLDHNGADDAEVMCSIDMKSGDLLNKDILATLGDGLYINNLWYLNFSDRQNGCLTGMTRFFCYVVKNQQPLAPFSVMRFDDSIYRIFGENLTHVTKERELIIDSSTYDERSTACAILPGIIAENVRFTL